MTSAVTTIEASSAMYPSGLAGIWPRVWAIGYLQLLEQPPLGFFCSTRCPGEIIIQTYDLAIALREACVPMIGGFHTPMEKECLALLLRGTQPLVLCPARSIVQMRLPTDWRQAVAAQRLLVLSPFAVQHRRPTTALTELRNRLVARLSAYIFIAYAAPQSKTAALGLEFLRKGRQVFILPHSAHAHLVAAGAQAATSTALPGCLR